MTPFFPKLCWVLRGTVPYEEYINEASEIGPPLGPVHQDPRDMEIIGSFEPGVISDSHFSFLPSSF